MIVLIAPEKDIPNEIEILHKLFEEGLTHYHLRKPDKGYEEHMAYLQAIDTKYHDRIVVHYFHELMNEFQLKGIHLQEEPRRQLKKHLETYVHSFKEKGKTVSSSFHEPETIEECSVLFDYHLLSPVFSSISKEGYEGRGFKVTHINKTIVGMGGVSEETIAETLKLGFKGVGVLGGIWNANDPIKSFKGIKKNYEATVR